jgi:predicted phosphodiesterase
MRIALISDIHANLPALRGRAGGHRATAGIDATYHLGDLVGYAPWPNETVSLLRGFRVAGIAGNYDSTVATDYKHCGCKYEDPRQEELSHLSYGWTREHCSAETKRFLGQLPFRMDIRPRGGHQAGPTVILVHGAPTLNTLYWTEDRSDAFCTEAWRRIAGARAGDVICFGHTHKPWHREIEGDRLREHGLRRTAQGRRPPRRVRRSSIWLTIRSPWSSSASSTTSARRWKRSVRANCRTTSPTTSPREVRPSQSAAASRRDDDRTVDRTARGDTGHPLAGPSDETVDPAASDPAP